MKKKPSALKLAIHVLQRFRERWPECANLSDRQVEHMVLDQIQKGSLAKASVRTPGGLYYPFTAGGRDGYAVVKRELVVTVLPETYCPEVTAFRTNGASHVEKRSQDRHDEQAYGDAGGDSPGVPDGGSK